MILRGAPVVVIKDPSSAIHHFGDLDRRKADQRSFLIVARARRPTRSSVLDVQVGRCGGALWGHAEKDSRQYARNPGKCSSRCGETDNNPQ